MKIQKEKIIKICKIVIIILILLLIYLFSKINIIDSKKNKIIGYKNAETEENITNAYYEVMSINGDDLDILITIENLKGIEKIISEDITIEGNGKEKIAIDKTLKEGEEYQLRLKLVGEENDELYTLVASTKPNIIVTNEDTLGDSTTKTVEIQYPNNENLINYYSIDNEETWIEYVGEIDIVTVNDFKLSVKSLYKEGNTIPNIETQFIAKGNSLLDVVDNYVNSRALGKIYIKDEIYTVHTYMNNTDTIIEKNTTYGDYRDIATSSTNAQNMVILKVDGDLTINSGVTLTAYSSVYGGPKGMLVYSTGTLTNNGTISMTGKGAKATGQNVYLWKNEDSTNSEYEYVPANGVSGASGGTAPGGYSGRNGGTPNAATGRMTGGGGGGAGQAAGYRGGSGSAGTSYSGGSGGGRRRRCLWRKWKCKWRSRRNWI